jgi:Zn-dependent peptidase ImmA (M78 family)
VGDHFAACLLMPRNWLTDRRGEGVRHPKHLARLFDVTEMAMLFRLKTLGYIQLE